MQPIPADQVRKTWQQIAVSAVGAIVAAISMYYADEVYRDSALASVFGLAILLHTVAALWFAARLTVPRDDSASGLS